MHRFASTKTVRRLGVRALLPLLAAWAGAAAAGPFPFPFPDPIPFPKPIPFNPEELVSITSGAKHNCATRRDGVVLCWGNNGAGAVGTSFSDNCGSFGCVYLPTRVAKDVNGNAFASTRVSAGWDHTCSLDAAGAPFCWGNNPSAQTGIPSLAQVWQPTPLGVANRFNAISAGSQTTCAVEPGATWCWGLLNDGRPGATSLNGDMSTNIFRVTLAPTNIQPSSANFQAVSTGYMHVCMQTNISGFNDVNCIGRNDFGELGYDVSIGQAFVIFGSTFGRPVGPPSSRGTFTCADRLNDGTVACAGQNVFGNLGDGTTKDSGNAVVVGGGAKLSRVAAGWTHACAIDPQQQAWCWGDNYFGQLGNRSRVRSAVPVLVGGGAVKFRALSAGYMHTCGIGTDNNLYCWGNNDAGQLGRGYVGSYDWEPRRPLTPIRM